MKSICFIKPLACSVSRSLSILLLLAIPGSVSGEVAALWKETFEAPDFWNRWHSEGGIWMVGAPTTGPSKAFDGLNCAATLLDRNYPPGLNTRLVRDRVFVVPAASLNPRLRVWHWFRGGPGAARAVELKNGASEWQSVAAVAGWDTEGWTRATFDLRPFAEQALQLAFRFQSNTNTDTAEGWFIDDVSLEYGGVEAAVRLDEIEKFESGLGAWKVETAGWQWGPPPPEVPAAPAGINSVGTTVNRRNRHSIDARFVSPVFEAPPGSANARLRFWHWFNIAAPDRATVEIAVNGRPWQALAQEFSAESRVWTRPSLDLRPFAGQDIQLSFHFISAEGLEPGFGWFIDDVVVESGDWSWDPLDAMEGFEAGLGNWAVDNGLWQIGAPTNGPTAAWDGVSCAGAIVAAGASAIGSRLVSPEFVLPVTNRTALLTFKHWHDLSGASEGMIEVRDGTGDWQSVGTPVSGQSAGWLPAQCDLTPYLQRRIQLGFRLLSTTNTDSAAAWFIDDARVEFREVPVAAAPLLRVEQLSPELINLCVDSAPTNSVYVLEACDDLSKLSDPSDWVELKALDAGSCESVYSTLSGARFFRLRATGP